MSQEHPCPRCEASYSTEADLTRHVEVVHRCPKCRVLLSNESEVATHLAQMHGLHYFGETLEPELAELIAIPGWEPPKVPISNDEQELYEWLRPICDLIARASKPEHALDSAPPELRDRVEYIGLHFERVKATRKLVRYKRLKDPARKAEYLVIALAHLDLAPSYALQRFSPPWTRQGA